MSPLWRAVLETGFDAFDLPSESVAVNRTGASCRLSSVSQIPKSNCTVPRPFNILDTTVTGCAETSKYVRQCKRNNNPTVLCHGTGQKLLRLPPVTRPCNGGRQVPKQIKELRIYRRRSHPVFLERWQLNLPNTALSLRGSDFGHHMRNLTAANPVLADRLIRQRPQPPARAK